MFSLYLSSKNSALHRWEQRQLQIERHRHICTKGEVLLKVSFLPTSGWENTLKRGKVVRWVCSAIGKGKMLLGRNRELSIRRGGPRSKEAAARACIIACTLLLLLLLLSPGGFWVFYSSNLVFSKASKYYQGYFLKSKILIFWTIWLASLHIVAPPPPAAQPRWILKMTALISLGCYMDL